MVTRWQRTKPPLLHQRTHRHIEGTVSHETDAERCVERGHRVVPMVSPLISSREHSGISGAQSADTQSKPAATTDHVRRYDAVLIGGITSAFIASGAVSVTAGTRRGRGVAKIIQGNLIVLDAEVP